ncbi:MAG: helix-turn-helix domain-containing protein [Jhaorihella sp.]
MGGRPPALSPEQRAEVRRLRDQDQRGIAELARLFQVSQNTIRRA